MLHLTGIYGGVLSTAIKNGRLDMALIYEPWPIRGVQFTTMIVEDLHLVLERTDGDTPDRREIPLKDAARYKHFLPEQKHTLRQIVDGSNEHKGLTLRLAGEVESVPSPRNSCGRNRGRAP